MNKEELLNLIVKIQEEIEDINLYASSLEDELAGIDHQRDILCDEMVDLEEQLDEFYDEDNDNEVEDVGELCNCQKGCTDFDCPHDWDPLYDREFCDDD